ncbi:MAG: NTP pyrophosphohydrolase [Sulfobacillus benefaciens]|uniref:NTP pyrophosphohydrolase n=1 Tax=Sulfobacillus benefaciens TaxID=453960 RepID=A0A2T2XIB0_9FIRM|nr:MAG: NTP pyrophosphohydrolase [Sulfobacillus benefaciens]
MTDAQDSHTTVGSLKEQVAHFVARRQWQTAHNPKNLAMSIAIEAAELMEHFQWQDLAHYAAIQDPEERQQVSLEVADVAIYLLSFCHTTGIDLSRAITDKLTINEARFPVAAESEARQD